MAATAGQSTTAPAGAIPTNTLLGWAEEDPAVEDIAPWFRLCYGEGVSSQFMSMETLNVRIAALPPAPPEPPDDRDPMVAEVHNGDAIPVTQANGTPYPAPAGIAIVADSTLERVTLTLNPTSALVANGASVPVRNWDNTTTPGPAVVSGSALTSVQLILVPGRAAVNNGAAVPVTDAAGDPQAGSPGVATVAANAVTKVQLTV